MWGVLYKTAVKFAMVRDYTIWLSEMIFLEYAP